MQGSPPSRPPGFYRAPVYVVTSPSHVEGSHGAVDNERMKLKALRLAQFRGFREAQFDFCEGIWLIHGPNGAGKTSLLEAIAYLSLPRSFRGVPDAFLVHRGARGFTLSGTVEHHGVDHLKVQFTLPWNGEPRKTKRVWINDKRARSMKELFERFAVLSFTPEDLAVLTGEREHRRRFMDRMMALLEPEYYPQLIAYYRALKQRNVLLRQNRSDATEERVFREELLRRSEIIRQIRKRLLAAWEGHWHVRREMFFPHLSIQIRYEPAPPTPERDRLTRTTTWGAHRDHYAFLVEDREVGTFLSHSELKLLLLSMFLAWVDLFRERGRIPVLVVDELLNTLSEDRLPGVLSAFEGLQCFLTHHQDLPGYTLKRLALQGAGVSG